MKRYEFNITLYYLKKFFIPIRSKTDVLEVLMEILNFILLKPDLSGQVVVGKIIIYIDKMSRFFIFSDKKYFSIVNPFLLTDVDGKIDFIFNDKVIDYAIISKISSLLKSNTLSGACGFGFIEEIYEDGFSSCDDIWFLFRDLLLMEDGYMRYDYDQGGYDEHKEKGEEHKHPLRHYDLCYSGRSTFKIGLENNITHDDFIDLLNITTDCKYLKN